MKTGKEKEAYSGQRSAKDKKQQETSDRPVLLQIFG
jgi:hypothetical protein